MKSPVRVTITGAAGQIGYQLAFRIASGQMLGADQPVILQLLEIPPALPALNGVVMELDDCAFDTLAGVVATDDPNVAFKDSDYALLVGARPRGPGMERKDLLEANAAIFSVQGKAITVEHHPRRISKHAMFVPVVNSEACTGCGICEKACPTQEAAIRVLQPELVQGRIGDHYRLGWTIDTPITPEFSAGTAAGGAAEPATGLDYLNEGAP